MRLLKEVKTFNATEELSKINFSMDLPLNMQMQPLNQTSQSFTLQSSREKDKTLDKI